MSERVSDGYLESYKEIPDEYIEDDSFAIKKLGGHRRLFRPEDTEGERQWFQDNYDRLCDAYGQKRVDSFLQSIGIDTPLSTSR